MNRKSRQAFVKRYGPMTIQTGYEFDINEYAAIRIQRWKIWEAAREWQRNNPKEK